MKRTLYFSRSNTLKIKNRQLLVHSQGNSTSLAVEDIGIVILDSAETVFTGAVLPTLLNHKVLVIVCDAKHLPTGILMPLEGNTSQTKVIQHQIEVPEKLKRSLWKSLITFKIRNQRNWLKSKDLDYQKLTKLSNEVRAGDSQNYEGVASAHYWKTLKIKRDRFGEPPNNMLNYGYAVARAIVARYLCVSGLLPVLGIFHRNQYNSYVLADDLIEPFRPMVDSWVLELAKLYDYPEELNTVIKMDILKLQSLICQYEGKEVTMDEAIRHLCARLASSYLEKRNLLSYPELIC